MTDRPPAISLILGSSVGWTLQYPPCRPCSPCHLTDATLTPSPHPTGATPNQRPCPLQYQLCYTSHPMRHLNTCPPCPPQHLPCTSHSNAHGCDTPMPFMPTVPPSHPTDVTATIPPPSPWPHPHPTGAPPLSQEQPCPTSNIVLAFDLSPLSSCNNYLWIFCDGHPERWADLLPMAEYSHNSVHHSSTGKSPFSLILGYEPCSYPAIGEMFLPALESRLLELEEARKEALAVHKKAQRTMWEQISPPSSTHGKLEIRYGLKGAT
jgi:hypothetical protein